MEYDNQCVIGLDVGHSTVKAVFDKQTGERASIIFPSVTMPAIKLSDESGAARAATDTVTINGTEYFVGHTAEVQGSRVANDVSENWISSNGYKALVAAAMKKITSLSGTPHIVVVGLPTGLFRSQRDQLRAIMTEIVGQNTEVRIYPQALGAYQQNFLDEEGRQKPNRSFINESWGVIEVGYFSTDFMVMRGSNGDVEWVEEASGICSGIHLAATKLVKHIHDEVIVNGTNITVTVREAESALQTGFVRHFGKVYVSEQVRKAIASITDEIDFASTRYMETEAKSLDGIVLAGGGAPLIYKSVKAKWHHTIMADNPRFSVAEGFYRLAKGVLRARKSLISK